jgi:hypothetical protein
MVSHSTKTVVPLGANQFASAAVHPTIVTEAHHFTLELVV